MIWNPRIVRPGSSVLYLPQPILQFQPSFDWKFQKDEVPLLDGSIVSGTSLRGPSITISGLTAARQTSPSVVSPVPDIDEDNQMAVLSAILTFLKSIPTGGFDVYDHSNSYISGCYPEHFDYNTGDAVANKNGPYVYTIRLVSTTANINVS